MFSCYARLFGIFKKKKMKFGYFYCRCCWYFFFSIKIGISWLVTFNLVTTLNRLHLSRWDVSIVVCQTSFEYMLGDFCDLTPRNRGCNSYHIQSPTNILNPNSVPTFTFLICNFNQVDTQPFSFFN